MPTFDITAPDGKKYRVTGETQEGAVGALKKHLGAPGMTLEQQKALAKARARIRARQAESAVPSQPAPQQPSTAGDIAASAATGLRSGIEGSLGMFGDAANMQGDLSAWIASKFGASPETQETVRTWGSRLHPGALMPSTKMVQEITNPVAEATGTRKLTTHTPQTTAGKYARTIGEFAPSAMLGSGRLGQRVAQVAVPAITSEFLGQKTEGSALEPYARVFGALVGGMGANALQRVKSPKIAMDELQRAKTAAYDATDALGIRYKPEDYKRLVVDIGKDVQAKHINPTRHPKAVSVVNEMLNEAKSGYAPTLRQLDERRQMIFRDLGKADEAEAFFGNRITDKLDDFIDTAQVGLSGDPSKAAPAIRQARELNRRWRNASTLEEALIKAERRAASTDSGANLENAVRQNVRRILDNKKTARFLNAQEKAALETVVRGTRGQNALRATGNLLRGPGGWAATGGGVAGSVLSGSPIGLAAVGAPLAGSAFKAASRGIGRANEQFAEQMLRGAPVQGARSAKRSNFQSALARALLQGTAAGQ